MAHHCGSGKLLHIRRGLYAVVPEGFDAESFAVDPYQVAARATDDAVVSYRSALALHGYGYSVQNSLIYLTANREASRFSFQDTEYVGVTHPIALLRHGKEMTGVESVDRAGLEIRVTTLERTLVDCFDRVELAGGIEEAWRSLEAVSYFDTGKVIAYLDLLGNSVTAAKVGFFLEEQGERLHISEKELDSVREFRPKQPTYMFRSERIGKLVNGWNLIVPEEILQRSWEEPL